MLISIKNYCIDTMSKHTDLYAKDLTKLLTIGYNHKEFLSNLQLSLSPHGRYFSFIRKTHKFDSYGLIFLTTIDACEVGIIWFPPYIDGAAEADLLSSLEEYNLNFIILIADERYIIGKDILGNWFPSGHISYSPGYAADSIHSSLVSNNVDVEQVSKSFSPNIARILADKFYYFNLSNSFTNLLTVDGVGILENNPPIYSIYDSMNNWDSIHAFLTTQSHNQIYKIFHKYPFNYPSGMPIERLNIYTHTTVKLAFEPIISEGAILGEPGA